MGRLKQVKETDQIISRVFGPIISTISKKIYDQKQNSTSEDCYSLWFELPTPGQNEIFFCKTFSFYFALDQICLCLLEVC